MSGFSHNGVTPLGMLHEDIPIIVSHSILELPFVWLGGLLTLSVFLSSHSRSPLHFVQDDQINSKLRILQLLVIAISKLQQCQETTRRSKITTFSKQGKKACQK